MAIRLNDLFKGPSEMLKKTFKKHCHFNIIQEFSKEGIAIEKGTMNNKNKRTARGISSHFLVPTLDMTDRSKEDKTVTHHAL